MTTNKDYTLFFLQPFASKKYKWDTFAINYLNNNNDNDKNDNTTNIENLQIILNDFADNYIKNKTIILPDFVDNFNNISNVNLIAVNENLTDFSQLFYFNDVVKIVELLSLKHNENNKKNYYLFDFQLIYSLLNKSRKIQLAFNNFLEFHTIFFNNVNTTENEIYIHKNLIANNNSNIYYTTEFLMNNHQENNKKKQNDSDPLRIIKLLSLLSTDVNISELEQLLKYEPKITYLLLHLANSAAINTGKKLTTMDLKQAILLLGVQTLKRWLQLLIYAGNGNYFNANMLLYKAAFRGKLAELLLLKYTENKTKNLVSNDNFFADNITTDTAFMMGTFSLLDLLLNRPISEILTHLPDNQLMKVILQDNQGLIGITIKILNKLYSKNYENIFVDFDILKTTYNISEFDFLSLQIQAYNFINQIH